MTCSRCHTPNRNAARFCRHCGAPLTLDTATAATAPTTICAGCGATGAPGSLCPRCGRLFPEGMPA